MTILTDILSLIRRGIFASAANPDDVIVLGVNEEPVMTGVASPIPYKSVKVIKVKDLKISPAFVEMQIHQKLLLLEPGKYFKNKL